MNVTVNGEQRELNDGITVSQLLTDLGMPLEQTVVEQNGDIVTHDKFAEVTLGEGDKVELIRFVGGG